MQRVAAFGSELGSVCRLRAKTGCGTSSRKVVLCGEVRVLLGSPWSRDFGAEFISVLRLISFSARAEKPLKKSRTWPGAEALQVRGKPGTAL